MARWIADLPTPAVHPAVDNLSTLACNPFATWLCGGCSLFVQLLAKNIFFKLKQQVSSVYRF
ncbi:hypothetical protein EMIT0P201_30630 [Pseudomonas chlororaphis]